MGSKGDKNVDELRFDILILGRKLLALVMGVMIYAWYGMASIVRMIMSSAMVTHCCAAHHWAIVLTTLYSL